MNGVPGFTFIERGSGLDRQDPGYAASISYHRIWRFYDRLRVILGGVRAKVLIYRTLFEPDS